MRLLKAHLTFESLGLGFFWAWCYCLWFVPNIHTNESIVSPGESYSWLIVLGSAAVIHFLIPAFLRTKRLSAFKKLYIVIPSILCLSTIGIQLSNYIIPSETLYYTSAVLAGISSAFLWHLWGNHYAVTKNDSAENIALGFGVVLLFSMLITSLMPSLLSNIFVILTPLISGGLLIVVRHHVPETAYPTLLPKGIRKISRMAIFKVCLIAFFACTIGTFTWAVIPTGELPLGFDSTALGVIVGALFMLVAALPKLTINEPMDTARIMTWILFLSLVAIVLFLTGSSELTTAAYIASMASTVVLDVLLATYFVALVVKGYVTSTTAFGYSEGFICAGMLFGNLLRNVLTGSEVLGNRELIGAFLLCICVLGLLIIFLNEQQRAINEIMTAPPDASDLEKRVAVIADEFTLSTREHEILTLLGQGHTVRSIANALVLSPLTVQTHIKNIYTKMQIHSRSELIDYINLNKTAFTVKN